MADCCWADGMLGAWLLCWFMLITAVQMMDVELTTRNYSPAPLRDPRLHMQSPMGKNISLHDLLGHLSGRLYTPSKHVTTTRLPEFVPDGTRPFIPDPTFMQGDVDIVVQHGDLAVLPCTVQNLGTRQISWKKIGDQHFLSVGTEVWVKDPNLDIAHYTWPAAVSDWNLVFREVRLEDSGVYECQIIASEKMTRRITLTVVEKPPHKPVISIEGKEFVESGQTVYLKCNTTEGDRIPNDVDWFKDGDKIEASRYPNIVITKFRSKDTMALVSELMIVSGSSNDSGTYICRSTSALIASVEVNVLVADSSNVKRGTGASHTQTRSGHNDGNTVIYFPFLTGNSLILYLILITQLIINTVIT